MTFFAPAYVLEANSEQITFTVINADFSGEKKNAEFNYDSYTLILGVISGHLR